MYTYLFKILLQEKERGGPVPWTDLFDRTHRRDKGKGEYADKKSEAVAVIKYLMQYIFIQIGFRISFFVKHQCIIFIYVDVRDNVNISYSSSTQCEYLVVQVPILKKKHGLEELLVFVLQVEDPMWRPGKQIFWRL